MTRPWRLGLVGHGIQHSLSPRLIANALAQVDAAGTYELFDCATDADALAVFERLRTGGLDGLNVTTPFKPLALKTADAWLRTAQHPGGVLARPANTLWPRDGRLVAASTDGHGLTSALLGAQVDLTGLRVLLLGAGGAGQAVAADLVALGVHQLRIANRTHAAAESLVAALEAIWPKRALHQPWGDAHGLSGIDLVVNATRLGHGGQAVGDVLDWLPWRSWAAQSPVLADMVYAPGLTPLQALAHGHGLPVDTRLLEPLDPEPRMHPELKPPRGVVQGFGQSMLAHQAARSFQLWTGLRVDARRMLAAIL